MTLTQIQRKRLIELYPYLQPRNVWTGKIADDYNYKYIKGEYDLPPGWFKLFLLYCKNIKPLLVQANMLDTFQFSQIKEKYGSMRLYTSGYPDSMRIITHLYESYSKQICHRCGQLAQYESLGWIYPWCKECVDLCPYQRTKIHKRKHLTIETYNPMRDTTQITNYTFRYLNREYKHILQMTDEEFYIYLTQVE